MRAKLIFNVYVCNIIKSCFQYMYVWNKKIVSNLSSTDSSIIHICTCIYTAHYTLPDVTISLGKIHVNQKTWCKFNSTCIKALWTAVGIATVLTSLCAGESAVRVWQPRRNISRGLILNQSLHTRNTWYLHYDATYLSVTKVNYTLI